MKYYKNKYTEHDIIYKKSSMSEGIAMYIPRSNEWIFAGSYKSMQPYLVPITKSSVERFLFLNNL